MPLPKKTPTTIAGRMFGGLLLLLLLSKISWVEGFYMTPKVVSAVGSKTVVSQQRTTWLQASGFQSADDNNNKTKPPKKNMSADFEYQELKIQLRAMKEEGVETRQLQESSRGLLEGYIRRILTRKESPLPIYQLGSPSKGRPNSLAGTTWQLAYSSQPLTAQSLPQGVQVVLDFAPDGQSLDYRLEFTKTFGLKRLTAQSTYQIDTSPVTPGYVTYTYQNITTDVFGFTNLGIGNLGLLDGRSSQIQTVFFDPSGLWIEVGTEGGMEFFNVYTLEEPERSSDDYWS